MIGPGSPFLRMLVCSGTLVEFLLHGSGYACDFSSSSTRARSSRSWFCSRRAPGPAGQARATAQPHDRRRYRRRGHVRRRPRSRTARTSGNLWELGIFGVLFISYRNALHDPRLPSWSSSALRPRSATPRLPAAALPRRGGRVHGAASCSRAVKARSSGRARTPPVSGAHAAGDPVRLDRRRSHGHLQRRRGDDSDPALHFGGGLKIDVHRTVTLRADVRDNITGSGPRAAPRTTSKVCSASASSSGAPRAQPGQRRGRRHRPARRLYDGTGLPPTSCPIRDRDGDGFPDRRTSAREAGIAPTGCPVRDADADGVLDVTDECRDVPGIAPTGCPTRIRRVLDRDDQCIDVPGIAPDGCPQTATATASSTRRDKCPNEAENKNGFEDDDGCPEEIPDAVKKFTGVIRASSSRPTRARSARPRRRCSTTRRACSTSTRRSRS